MAADSGVILVVRAPRSLSLPRWMSSSKARGAGVVTLCVVCSVGAAWKGSCAALESPVGIVA